jgi:hypothetical protein
MRGRLRLVATLTAGAALAAAGAGNGVARPASGAASQQPRVASVGGPCTKPTAVEVMTQAKIGVDILTGKTPVQQVLCGAFLGPGSSGMVASVAIPSCGFSVGWAVFRNDGADWQLVLHQDHGAFLAKVGNDIKETMGVLRPGDAHCFPSAERSRIWHWNGSALAPSAWKLKELRPAARSRHHYFLSPSRNIYCAQGDEGFAMCATRTPRRVASLRYDGRLTVCTGVSCLNNDRLFNGSPILAYGQTNDQGGFLCTSRVNGITCTVKAGRARGKGYRIARAGVTRIG